MNTKRISEQLRKARISRNEDRPEEAENYYLKALQLYRTSPEVSPLPLANTLRGLAILKNAPTGQGKHTNIGKKHDRCICRRIFRPV